MTSETDPRIEFPASTRNREPIFQVLKDLLPKAGLVLDIGSGPGQHVAYFAPKLPHLTWQPSDPDPNYRASIAAWTAEDAPMVPAPLDLDATRETWPLERADAALCINVIHIAPWEVCLGVLRGASKILSDGGLLFLYGPFMIGGRHTSEGNAAFDLELRGRDPGWGIRDLDEVALEARKNDLHLTETIKMPANNLSVVFRKRAGLSDGDG